MLLFEGTLSFDGGPAIPAQLELAVDRRELARLLANTGAGSDAPDKLPAVSPKPVLSAGAKRPASRGFEPIEIREHPGRRIKFEMLERISDPAKIWAALAERFPWANFKVPAGGELTAGDLGEVSDELSQLESDWLTIEPHLDDLVTDQGRPVRGYQSRIAEALGGTNDGHFRRARVEPLVTRFRAWIDEEWVFTSSSSGEEEADCSDETAESSRVA